MCVLATGLHGGAAMPTIGISSLFSAGCSGGGVTLVVGAAKYGCGGGGSTLGVSAANRGDLLGSTLGGEVRSCGVGGARRKSKAAL